MCVACVPNSDTVSEEILIRDPMSKIACSAADCIELLGCSEWSTELQAYRGLSLEYVGPP